MIDEKETTRLLEPEVQERVEEGGNRLPLSRLFPNIVTIMGLCSGLSAIRFALDGRFEHAVIAIIVAGILDGMDGRLARMLKASSTFGAQLDSLADFISFGVAPAVVVYIWNLHSLRGVGWAVALFFAVCCAVRLARFNTATFEPRLRKPDADRFFTGVPAPCGGSLAILPMMLSFDPVLWTRQEWLLPSVNAVYLAGVALLMASRLPTLSLKRLHVHAESAMYVMLGAGLLITLAIIEPWATFPALCLLYLASLPVTWWISRRSAAQQN